MVIFGGKEYVSGQITDYIINKRECLINNSDYPDRIYNELYYFIQNSEFCSCYLYENLIREVIYEMAPTLDYALEHSKYHDDKWYADLVILNHQINGWPEFRKNPRPEYWKLLGLEMPITWHKIRVGQNKKEFMVALLDEEKKLRDVVLEFELKLCTFLESLGSLTTNLNM
jgi:hypothetical protein